MAWIRRHWTPHEADEWTREDWIAIVLSPISYILITVGLAMSLFLLPVGFLLLGIGIVVTIVLFWVVDPKLKALSSGYEKRQRDYLKELEEIQRWKE
jgi:antibiotic biosynthesis monooxygenase (ABM) superfamily enzyme